jgi:hypothetical protein
MKKLLVDDYLKWKGYKDKISSTLKDRGDYVK